MAKETESQKAIREAIGADQERRRQGRIVKSDRITDAPGDDCPGCHGKVGPTACPICGV